jgi:DNA-directed RNA polymerase specialized sigma24 family protein
MRLVLSGFTPTTVRAVLAYAVRRAHDAQDAADVVAETF